MPLARAILTQSSLRRDRAGFEVDDAGPGFLEGDDERAFGPFYRRVGIELPAIPIT